MSEQAPEGPITIRFTGTVTMERETSEFLNAEGNLRQAVQNEVGCAGVVVEEAEEV